MKNCFFKQHNIEHIDYKDTHVLSNFLNPYGRMISSRRSGTSSKMQRKLSQAIKRARYMGLLAYINR